MDRAKLPDQLALIEGVGNFGCYVAERGTTQMIIKIFKASETYEILVVIPVQREPKEHVHPRQGRVTEKYVVICKGAGNII